MKWVKLGRVLAVDGRSPWMVSHAAVPIAEHLHGDVFRIYFSSRDRHNRSFTGWAELIVGPSPRLLRVGAAPVLGPGVLGAFDDSGSMATWLVKTGRSRLLYYIGWNLGVTVPFRNAIGLAAAGEDGEFRRVFPGPIVDRTATEPHFCASCCVLPGDDKWRMWYLSCVGWELAEGMPRHRYHIKSAQSQDGLYWQRNGVVAIDFKNAEEYAISRPSVVRDADCWRMWYSYRGDSYRIGYAESGDGEAWVRKDAEAGLDVSPDGWDSEMIEYPFVFDHDGRRYMLYNGNGYGRSGIGLAVLERG